MRVVNTSEPGGGRPVISGTRKAEAGGGSLGQCGPLSEDLCPPKKGRAHRVPPPVQKWYRADLKGLDGVCHKHQVWPVDDGDVLGCPTMSHHILQLGRMVVLPFVLIFCSLTLGLFLCKFCLFPTNIACLPPWRVRARGQDSSHRSSPVSRGLQDEVLLAPSKGLRCVRGCEAAPPWLTSACTCSPLCGLLSVSTVVARALQRCCPCPPRCLCPPHRSSRPAPGCWWSARG